MTELHKINALSLRAMSLNIPTDPHPLTRIGEPSDTAPEGSGGARVMITVEAAKKNLDSLLGMAIDYQADFAGHDPQTKIGVITGAAIEDNAIRINGVIYAADFPELAAEIKANKGKLGFSFEARDLLTDHPEADPIPIVDCVFTGAAILLKEKAAYWSTSIAASAVNNRKKQQSPNEQHLAILRAESERRFQLAEMQCARDLRRLGIEPSGGKIDPPVLQNALRNHKVAPGEAMRIKAALAAKHGGSVRQALWIAMPRIVRLDRSQVRGRSPGGVLDRSVGWESRFTRDPSGIQDTNFNALLWEQPWRSRPIES
jgi:hypothetical protein